jgi:23S rRNA pseudouridine2605 synthase
VIGRHTQHERSAAPGQFGSCGIARALSKLGYCSRAQAWNLVLEQRVRVNGKLCRNPEARVNAGVDQIEVDGQPIVAALRRYLMLNKPRGLVTSRSDEQGRDTIYSCLNTESSHWLAPVGRLDKASEGLLLLTNDTVWADLILSPARHIEKRYHVQIHGDADAILLDRLSAGVETEDGTLLAAKRVHLLRKGSRNCWLEFVLDEGKNRHIRRLLEACGIEVLRLVRVAIGSLQLGDLPKGQSRDLTRAEVNSLRQG